MNNKSDILLSASEIQPGETLRVICPTCGGGSTQELSLVITRGEDGHLVWVCHRATCPTKGGDGGSGMVSPSTKKPTKKIYTGTTEQLSDSLRGKLFELWGVTDPPHWYWAPELGRLAMSVRSPKYRHRGWVMRDLRGRAKIKALTYLDEGEESLSWYKSKTNAPTVLVEDIPSAVRGATHVNTVALLGTGVGLGKAEEIAKYATRPIIVALDQDATGEAFDRVQRYALLWDNPQILMLDKDIKNMTNEQIQQLLGDMT